MLCIDADNFHVQCTTSGLQRNNIHNSDRHDLYHHEQINANPRLTRYPFPGTKYRPSDNYEVSCTYKIYKLEISSIIMPGIILRMGSLNTNKMDSY